MKFLGGKKLVGGQATRAEVYGLFFAAVLLIGGGIGGAVALTGGGLEEIVGSSETPTPQESASTSSGNTGSSSAEPLSSPSAEPDAAVPGQNNAGVPGQNNVGESQQSSSSPQASQPTREEQFHGAPVEPLPAPRTIPAPDVIGWTYEQVQQWTLANLGRNPAWQDTNCYGSQFPPGTVARQSPVPGTPIVDDFDPVTTSASGPGIAIWMERDSYVGPNWYSAGRCTY